MGLSLGAATFPAYSAEAAPSGPRFEVARYEVEGNALLTPAKIETALAPFAVLEAKIVPLVAGGNSTVKEGQALKEGFYFDVTEGAIEVLNNAGPRVFAAVAFGYVADENTLAEPLSEDLGLVFVLPSELSDHPGVRGVPRFSSAAAYVVR